MFAGYFRYSLTWILEKIVVCAGVFLQCSLDALCTGKHKGIFAGFFRYSFTWSLEKSWYVPVFFYWLLVKKLISQKHCYVW